MKVSFLLVLTAALLPGCIEPPPPSQAEVALRGACDDGDMAACTALLNAETQIATAPRQPYIVTHHNPADFQQRQAAPTALICSNGRVVYSPGYCPSY